MYRSDWLGSLASPFKRNNLAVWGGPLDRDNFVPRSHLLASLPTLMELQLSQCADVEQLQLTSEQLQVGRCFLILIDVGFLVLGEGLSVNTKQVANK